MAVITYPLNGVDYLAEDAETYLCTRMSGVYSSEDNFALSINGSMQVSIGPGIAWIKDNNFAGKSVVSTEAVVLDVSLADTVLNRKDRIVLRFDRGLNATNIVLKQGTPSSVAEAPSIERTGTVFELGLYVIDIPAGTISLTQSKIVNTMLDENVCGLMRDAVTGIPTAQLQARAEEVIKDIEELFSEAVSGLLPRHAITHAKGGKDEITPASIGALSEDDRVVVDSVLSSSSTNPIENRVVNEELNKKESKSTVVTGSEATVNLTVADNTDYSYTAVRYLTMEGANVNCHGFITFHSSYTPSINVRGFSASSGDDIDSAERGEIWEFSVYTHNGKSFIIWKNWSD